jgi:predicted nucleic acid-binding protein
LILADTSVWIDHFRAGNTALRDALNRGQIVIHPHIVAELALGSLRDRFRTLATLDLLPHLRVAHMNELRHMIEARHLYNLGIGLTDAHLIAAAFLNPPTLLWTLDKRLRKVAQDLGIHSNLP